MRIEITKGQSDDRIVATLPNGTSVETRFPKKGPLPHDAVHLFVEQELRLKGAFWGLVAVGHHPESLVELAKAVGHASASRAEVPQAHIVELLQAERLVECFEADLWSGYSGDPVDLLAVADTACQSSFVSMPAIDAAAVNRIRERLKAFAGEWMAAPAGHVAVLEWREGE